MSNYNVPEGWTLVPVEPTREMFVAANKADDKAYADGRHHGADNEDIWHAMLAAAPAAPAQAEPVAVAITEKQVMTAYFSASRLHISGTSNWVAAFAQSLNKQIAAPPAIPAQPDASVLSILREARESVRYHKGMQNLGHEAGKQHAAELAALIERIDAALAGKGGE